MVHTGKVAVAGAILFGAGLIYAQNGPGTQKPIQVDIDLVMVNASVTNGANEAITSLRPEHFQLFEDKIQQEIRYFASDTVPLSLGVVFDVSHSMEDKIEFAREAAVTFLEHGTPDDEYFLVEFSSRAHVSEDFTSDISRLRDRLSFKPAIGTTALYDAVYLGLTKVKSGQNPKKALLLITDGEDNHSRYSRRDIREFIRESDVQIYIIDLGRALVSDLAEMTGGRSYRGSVDDLEDICRKIALELKNQYIIGYESTNGSKDGLWRKIRLNITPPAGMARLYARTKQGYYGPKN